MRRPYCDLFLEHYATSVIACGGTNPIFNVSLNCIKSNRSLFTFRGTSGSANVLARLYDLYVEFYETAHAGGGAASRTASDARAKELVDRIDEWFGDDAQKQFVVAPRADLFASVPAQRESNQCFAVLFPPSLLVILPAPRDRSLGNQWLRKNNASRLSRPRPGTHSGRSSRCGR